MKTELNRYYRPLFGVVNISSDNTAALTAPQNIVKFDPWVPQYAE